MVFLGIDYGRRKVGLAISGGKLAAPMRTLMVKSDDDLLVQLKAIVSAEGVEKIIIGLPDGRLAPVVRRLIPRLERSLGVDVIAWDETLTSRDAYRAMIDRGIAQKKRYDYEDAVAATLILQSYLDASR